MAYKNVITRIETNKRYVSDLELKAIAEIFQVSYVYLIDGGEEWSSSSSMEKFVISYIYQKYLHLLVDFTVFYVMLRVTWKHMLKDKQEREYMQSTGIVRKLDSLGRITLPMELRKSFDIGDREPLEIFTEDDKVIIKKYNPSDIFTGQCEDLVEYKGKKVSRDSIRELARIAGFTLSEE